MLFLKYGAEIMRHIFLSIILFFLTCQTSIASQELIEQFKKNQSQIHIKFYHCHLTTGIYNATRDYAGSKEILSAKNKMKSCWDEYIDILKKFDESLPNKENIASNELDELLAWSRTMANYALIYAKHSQEEGAGEKILDSMSRADEITINILTELQSKNSRSYYDKEREMDEKLHIVNPDFEEKK